MNATLRFNLQDLFNSLASLVSLAKPSSSGDGPTAGDCDLCGCWDGRLHDGVCSACDDRLQQALHEAIVAQDPGAGPHPYTIILASRVRQMLGSVVVLPSERQLADAIEEALWFAARDLRAGREVHLHHIGDLLLSDEGHGPNLGCMPDPDLLRGYRQSELGI